MPDENVKTETAQPMQAFGAFFKNYALGLSIVVAALPVAALRYDTIPQFESMKSLLAILGSGSSFLLVGVIFARRHTIARLFFPWWRQGEKAVARSAEIRQAARFAWLPIILSMISLVAIVGYFSSLYKSYETIAYRNAVTDTGSVAAVTDTGVGMSDSLRHLAAASRCAGLSPGGAETRFDAFVLNFGPPVRVVVTCSTTRGEAAAPLVVHRSVEFFNGSIIDSMRVRMPAASVPQEIPMNILFFLAFTTASAAFVLTGLKDYLQKELGFTDRQLIQQQGMQSRQDSIDVEGIPGLTGMVDYTPGYPDLATPTEPRCVWHNRPLAIASIDHATGSTTGWKHLKEDDRTPEIPCQFTSSLTLAQLNRKYRASWEAIVRGDAPPDHVDPTSSVAQFSPVNVQMSAGVQSMTSAETAAAVTTAVAADAAPVASEKGQPSSA